MKRINILLIGALLALLMINCERTEIPTLQPEKIAANDDGERISYMKKSAFSNGSNQSQQPFELEYVSIPNDSTFAFLISYLSTDDYKLHEFDFVWDEKLVDDNEGKTWMNIEVYHKTNLANATSKVADSVQVVISDLLKFKPETTSKLWLRFINTNEKTNFLTIKYERITISENENNPGTDSSTTTQDTVSTVGNTNTGNTNTGNTNSGNTGDEGNTGSTGDTENGGTTGTTAPDSISIGENDPGTGATTTPPDSGSTEGTTVIDSTNSFGEVIFHYQVIPSETLYLEMNNEPITAFLIVSENKTRKYLNQNTIEKQMILSEKNKYLT